MGKGSGGSSAGAIYRGFLSAPCLRTRSRLKSSVFYLSYVRHACLANLLLVGLALGAIFAVYSLIIVQVQESLVDETIAKFKQASQLRRSHTGFQRITSSLTTLSLDSPSLILPRDLAAAAKQRKPPHSSGHALSALFLSKSASRNSIRRHLVRAGWVDKAQKDSADCWCDAAVERRGLCSSSNQVCRFGDAFVWAHRFVAGGVGLDDDVKSRVQTELAEFFDLVLYPRADSYRNLTQKVLWMLDFVHSNIHVDYIVLLDDDCFVDMGRVAGYIASAPRTKFYGGHVEKDMVPVARGRSSRWPVARLMYNSSHYPPYAWGAGIIISGDVAGVVLQAAERWARPVFGVDDAFIGVLLNHSGVPVVNIKAIYTGGLYKRLGCSGDYVLPNSQPLIVAGSEFETLAFISAIKSQKSLCTVFDGPTRIILRVVISPYFPLTLLLLGVAFCIVLFWRWYLSVSGPCEQ